jgi:hypothetical protein
MADNLATDEIVYLFHVKTEVFTRQVIIIISIITIFL